MEYYVVARDSLVDLVESVTARLNDGWITQGSVTVYGTSIYDTRTYYQAMIKVTAQDRQSPGETK